MIVHQIYSAWIALEAVLRAVLLVGLFFSPLAGAPGAEHPFLALLGAALISLAWSAGVGRMGAYARLRERSLASHLADLGRAHVACGAIASTTALLLGFPEIARSFIGYAAVLFLIEAAVRYAFSTVLHSARRRGTNQKKVAIVGSGRMADDLRRRIEENPDWGLEIVGFVDDEDFDGTFRPVVPHDRIHKLVDLPMLLREHSVSEVLVACPRSLIARLSPMVRVCAELGIPVTLLSDLFGDMLPPPRAGRLASLPTLSFSPVHHDPVQLFTKRTIDLLGALVGIIVSAPFMALCIAAVRLTSSGPAFFRQKRAGMRGESFEMLKLRTMYLDAEEQKAGLMHLNEMDGPVFKIENDPRITPVGRLLRQFSIDEFPQFWNVLRGEMSLVGPRPLPVVEANALLDADRRRLSMRPGLTCLWQISGRSDVNFAEWMKLDLEYIDCWNLGLDLRVLLQTFPAVLLGRGAK